MDIKEIIKNKINALEKEKQELAESDIWIEQALKLAVAIEIKIDILKELLEEIEREKMSKKIKLLYFENAPVVIEVEERKVPTKITAIKLRALYNSDRKIEVRAISFDYSKMSNDEIIEYFETLKKERREELFPVL